MKKFLSGFFIIQLFLFSYIFSQSLYPIYSLNHLVDENLSGYKIEEANGGILKDVYEHLQQNYLYAHEIEVQLIKTPVSNHTSTIYEVYHSDLDNCKQIQSVSDDKVFIYKTLEKEDFIDSTGIFYTNLSMKQLDKIEKSLNISIKNYKPQEISYGEAFKLNSIDFIALFLLTLLVLFMYTFIRIKTNAVKKVLGYSPMRMISDSLQEFLVIQGKGIATVFILHIGYYTAKGAISASYFLGLIAWMFCIIFINIAFLFVTTITIRFIDIHTMVKNKIYSTQLVYILKSIKMVIVVTITIVLTFTLNNYLTYKNSLEKIEKYKDLNGYYTGNAYNSDEYDQIFSHKEKLVEISKEMKQFYHEMDTENYLLFEKVNVLNFAHSKQLFEANLNSYNNYVILNEHYIQKFIDLQGAEQILTQSHSTPIIFVPKKYAQYEKEIKNLYIDLYNDAVKYDQYEGIAVSNAAIIQDIQVVYIENGLSHSFFTLKKKGIESIQDSIIMLDIGNFSGLYYLNALSNQQLSFALDSRELFIQKLHQYKLNELINAATLLTPFLTEISYNKFVMMQSVVFSIIFIATLLFIIYATNFIEIMVNRKRMAIEYTLGFNLFRSLVSDIFITFCMMILTIPFFLFRMNGYMYASILLVDIFVYFTLYYTIVRKNISPIIKGG